ncbi:phage tail tip lysozyme [uncultured Alistipes sp.]|uniref:phage tail tip lysozyme n=1 Tax=uncultured Alistipes sp. TaxID=538949 RepID=UPI00321FCC2A
MATKISNCGSNENGKTTGGKAGDQTGKEYRVISWYSRPWKCVLRFPDPKVGEEIARISEAAAKNDNVGYCQTHRRTYHDALKAANWNPAAIKKPVETDCSASTLANIIAAGHKCGIAALKQINPDGYTGNMRAALKKAGFTVLTDSKYLTSSDYLLPGDILLNDNAHAAVNLTAGPKAKAAAVTTPAASATGNNEKAIWNFLIGKGMNAYAAAGIMGNLYAESAFNPRNLQNSYEKKIGLTDEEYTAAVDAGTYTNFAKDCAGYGLAQWTYHTRKQGLLSKAKAAGKSVGDLNIQLSFLWEELQGYKKVMQQLKAAGSVAEAASAFMIGFERPADQSATAQKKRASYGQKYFDKYAGSRPAAPSTSGKNEPDAAYKVGRNYTLQANMYVRKTPNGEKLSFSALTADGKAHGYADGAGKAILKKGTVVTCNGLEKAAGGAIWVKIPSGYVCGISGSGEIYIK